MMIGYGTTVLLQVLLLCGLGVVAGILWFHVTPAKTIQQSTGHTLPNPFNTICWLEKDGLIQWSNDAYKVAKQHALPTEHGLSLFDVEGVTKPSLPFRGKLRNAHNDEVHFEIIETEGHNGSWFAAKSIQSLVQTEAELKRFVQTLADTFSHLPTGLAIFDKDRDLSLFNPALSEILNLGPEWLAKRPSLEDCLNRIHLDGLLPEPKDFKRWRDAFAKIAQSGNNQSYQEDWHLPDARVLRVTARPHLGNATALMIDDITGHVRVEQRYRGELEQAFSALECIGHAIIIFDASGEMSFANASFDELWGDTVSESFTPTTVEQLCIGCSERFPPSHIWSELVDFGERRTKGSQMKEVVPNNDGQLYQVIASSISGGRVMCEFLPLQQADGLPQMIGMSA